MFSTSPSRLSAFVALLIAASSAVLAVPYRSGTEGKDVARAFSLLRRQGSTVYRSCTQPNTVALTFDDGPYIYQNYIVDTLNNAGVKGTFFINGNNWLCIYTDSAIASLRKAYDSGHLLGSHTWSHLNLTQQTVDKINDEMWNTQLAMSRIIGAYPSWFRPPFGSYNDQVLQAAASRNMNTVLWDFDSGDSTGSTVQQIEAAYRERVNQHPSNILAINHETYNTTVYSVLPYAIQLLKGAGYNIVTVAECVGSSTLYWNITTPGIKDSSWKC